MGNCDVCNSYITWEEGTAYTADEFRTIVRKGFEPPATIQMLGPAAVQGWKNGLVANSTTGWLLCPSCAQRAARYLPKPAGTDPTGQILFETMATETLLGLQSNQAASSASLAVPAPAAVSHIEIIYGEHKICPACEEQIPTQAGECPHCQARFRIAYQGYCCTERAVLPCDEQGKCLKCGQAVLDRAVVSTYLDDEEALDLQPSPTPAPETGAEALPVAAEGIAVASPVLAGAALPDFSQETKKCPECGEVIKLEARVCRFCNARFDVSEVGYCPGCHTLVQPSPAGKCPVCQAELLDRRLESTLVATTPTVEAASPAVEPTPTPAPAEWQGRPIRWWQLYLSPNGRIGRLSFFVKGILGLLALSTILLVPLAIFSSGNDSSLPVSEALMPIFALWAVLYLWGLVMLIVKRFHDLNRSGWNMLLWLIPFVGQFIYLINLIECFFVRGSAGFNRFGPQTDRAFLPKS